MVDADRRRPIIVLHSPVGVGELLACPLFGVVFPTTSSVYLFFFFCRMFFARPDNLETWPCYFSLRFLTFVRSWYRPMACWMLLWTSSLVTWSLYKMRKIFRKHLISMAFTSSADLLRGSMFYKHTDIYRTSELISLILELTLLDPYWL